MQRYFVPPEQFRESSVRISGADAHHLIRVLRSRIGERFICSNGVDREALVEIVGMEKDAVMGKVIEERPMISEPKTAVWVAQSLPKGDKMDWIVQKCTEMGAAGFLPFVSERTVVQYDARKETKRVERWKKIVKEAAEQAQRNRIPAVEPPQLFQQLLKGVPQADLALICCERGERGGLKDVLQAARSEGAWSDEGNKRNGPTILLLVGPEGGFSEREVEEAVKAGCRPVHLGKRILRTETAAMAALACIFYEFGEMGG